MTDNTERRRHERIPQAVLLEFYKDGEKDTLQGSGFVTDLSEGGLAFETAKKLESGESFILRFTLPNGWNFDILGNVVHATRGVLVHKYGVEFTKVNPDLGGKLKSYIIAHIATGEIINEPH